MNSNRIKMENYQGVLYCDAILDGEFSLNDLEYMRAEIRKNFSSLADVIFKKTGTYSVSPDTQTTLYEGIGEFRNFVYVVDNEMKRNSAEYAADTYMRSYNTRVVNAKEEAYAMLCETDRSKLSEAIERLN